MRKRVVAIASVVAVAAMCAFIFWMSAQPADESSAMSMGIVSRIIGFIVPGYDQMSAADQLHWQEMLEHPVRKAAHFLEYLTLGALTLNAVLQVARARAEDAEGKLPLTRRMGAIAWAFAIAYATSDEIHQIFVPGRTFFVTDILLDSCGALVGILIAALLLRRI